MSPEGINFNSEQRRNQADRVLSDAEMIKGGAKIGETGDLKLTPDQIENIAADKAEFDRTEQELLGQRFESLGVAYQIDRGEDGAFLVTMPDVLGSEPIRFPADNFESNDQFNQVIEGKIETAGYTYEDIEDRKKRVVSMRNGVFEDLQYDAGSAWKRAEAGK